jgi:hypothetical protein
MKYYAPVVEVELFDAADVIVTSGGSASSFDPASAIEGPPDIFND